MIAMQYSFTLPAQATPREVKTDQDRRRCGRQTVVADAVLKNQSAEAEVFG